MYTEDFFKNIDKVVNAIGGLPPRSINKKFKALKWALNEIYNLKQENLFNKDFLGKKYISAIKALMYIKNNINKDDYWYYSEIDYII